MSGSLHALADGARELHAGSELDALLAEKVFGAVDGRCPCDDGLTRTATFTAPTLAECEAAIREHYTKAIARGVRFWPVEYCGPKYSAAIGDAMQALDQLGGIVTIKRMSADEWHVTIGDKIVWAETAPLAICRAALLAAESR